MFLWNCWVRHHAGSWQSLALCECTQWSLSWSRVKQPLVTCNAGEARWCRAELVQGGAHDVLQYLRQPHGGTSLCSVPSYEWRPQSHCSLIRGLDLPSFSSLVSYTLVAAACLSVHHACCGKTLFQTLTPCVLLCFVCIIQDLQLALIMCSNLDQVDTESFMLMVGGWMRLQTERL